MICRSSRKLRGSRDLVYCVQDYSSINGKILDIGHVPLLTNHIYFGESFKNVKLIFWISAFTWMVRTND